MGIRQLITSPEIKFDRVSRLRFFGPSSCGHHDAVIMIRPLVAIGALVVLAAVAEASYRHDSYEDNKYDHDYKHEPQYYEEKYQEPTYEKYDDDYGYEEHNYDYRPMYKSLYGYGGDSYGKSYSSYEDDHYGDDSYEVSYRHKRQAEDDREGQASMNPEVSPGCFSSPLEDCGEACVTSFDKDEECHRCCCQEIPVNETMCALPVSSGDVARCRGNFERWAFNGETGNCEPFTYGGCGGNGNRFMCQEMCERHCVNEKGREGQQSFSGCHSCIRISGKKDGARIAHPDLYGKYTMGPGLINNRDWYIKVGGGYALWALPSGNWMLGKKNKKGRNFGFIHGKFETTYDCPHWTPNKWRYFAQRKWNNAGSSFKVRVTKCK